MKKIFTAFFFIGLIFVNSAYGIPIRQGIELGGTVQGEMRWQKYKDPAGGENDSTSDLYLRRIELRFRTAIPDWLKTSVVLNSEWIGDDLHDNDTNVNLYEATIRIQKEGVPGFIEIGKKMLDFGLFENHLLTYPLTRDLYETRTVGFTFGYEQPMYDFSVTVYDSEEMIEHFVNSGLIEGLQRSTEEYSDDIGSYLVSLKAYSNQRQNILSLGYISEPGTERNETIAVGLGLSYSRTRLLGEYFKALKREKFSGLTEEYKESTYRITLTYGAISPRTGAPQKLVLRYEHLDDDGMAEALGTYSLKDRYSVGIISGLFSDKTAGIFAYMGLEYRYSKYRTYQPMKDTNQEVYLRVALDF